MKPKIFIFVNSGQGTDWQHAMAIAEDGTVLANHVCSHRGFVLLDMGINGTRKHEYYKAHYPDGFELVDVPDNEVATHAGLAAAYQLNQEQGLLHAEPKT